MSHIRFGAASVSILVLAGAGPALAQEAVHYSLVAPELRLTPVKAFGDAAPMVKLVMGGLLLASVAAVAIWAQQLVRLRRGEAVQTAFLQGLAAAGPLLGLYGAVYGLLNGFLGISNIRPAPTLTVVAPGIAEALLCLGIGLFAAWIAVICRWQLEGRISRARTA
ncbi:MAG TPA: MotA/TolQ/ExbB proton channel family protein [Caulobacteraceae bacterium]|jgi:biopolymer transport protein ExbB/TolQ|nr:MotA/TolQ/ExbB proton channel family protein [Caulobacteraceae bacterium]